MGPRDSRPAFTPVRDYRLNSPLALWVTPDRTSIVTILILRVFHAWEPWVPSSVLDQTPWAGEGGAFPWRKGFSGPGETRHLFLEMPSPTPSTPF